jgi:hypothetical protein
MKIHIAALSPFIALACTHQPNATNPVTHTSSCPAEYPANWATSSIHRSVGNSTNSVQPQSGVVVIEVRGDASNPVASNAQLSFRNRTVQRDTVAVDSTRIEIVLPQGRYLFRARRIGFRTVQDSLDVRPGYADTVRVILATDITCLLSA